MSGFDYGSFDLATLKQIIESSDISWLDSSAQQFDQGTRASIQAAEEFMAQVSALGAAWEGPAATAAVQDAQSAHQIISQMHTASTGSSAASKAYYASAKNDQAQARAVPNVDDSWGHAIVTGAPGGLVGIGAAKLAQHQNYEAAHRQVAAIANRMDTNGTAQADTMRAQSWPNGPTTSRTPPSSLPPVPGSGGRSGAIGGNYSVAPRGGGAGSGYSAPVGGPTMNPGDSQIANDGVKGGNGGRGTGQPTHGDPTHQVSIPATTTPQGTDIATGPLTPGLPPTQAIPSTPSVVGGAGTAAAVLGGAGLLGAGALGSSALAGGGRYGAAGEGLAEGSGARGRPGALAEGEGSGVRSGAGALGEGESAGRPRLGGPGLAEEELGMRGRGLVSGTSEGFLGEPVAGEAGRLGGYPGGGAGSRRRDDDEEAPVPDYLVETEDVWGDGVIAAPPVIGE